MGKSTVIRATLLSFSLLALAACSSYYPYPETTYSGFGEYAEDYPQKYDAPEASRTSYYYPWWSMDYFYLGNHYYHPFGFSSFSYPFAGYPWYSPYHGYRPYPGYYASWNRPYYGYPYYDPRFSWGGGVGYGHGWQDPFWYHRYRGHDHYRYGGNQDPGTGGNAIPGPQPIDRRPGRYADRYDRVGEEQQMPINRRVSVAPAGAGSDRGMVVINRGDGKVRQNRVQPMAAPEGSGNPAVQSPPPSVPSVSVQPARRPVQATSRVPPSNRPAHVASLPPSRPEIRAVDPGSRPYAGDRQGRIERGDPDDR